MLTSVSVLLKDVVVVVAAQGVNDMSSVFLLSLIHI